MDSLAQAKMDRVLGYKIHEASSSTENYPPQNILMNRPSDPSSRWSSDTNCHPQFIILKFKPAIVSSVTFGKYEKMHVCNVRKFEIYGGLEQSAMILLYGGELRNDSFSETFSLKTTVGGKQFPIQYLKIVPIQTWGSSFNYSIWYVELRGTDDPQIVATLLDTVPSFRRETAIRLCLKMIRDLGLDDCFETLKRHVSVPLEHPFISGLYDTVVKRGDFQEAEVMIEEAAEKGLLSSSTADPRIIPVWTEIHIDPRGSSPGMRGGHQMVLDPACQMVYLFGGFDGTRDLADFWQYDLTRKKWILISVDTEQENGPTARSCHKMVMDSDNQTIYLIGRYMDSSVRNSDLTKTDFFMYDILRKRWTELSSDTHGEGGPKAWFDHQMVFDSMRKTVYVYGGRTTDKRPTIALENTATSDMHAYHIPTNTWRRIHLDPNSAVCRLLKPRKGQGIVSVFYPGKRLIYIIGGRCGSEVMEMVAFHVDKETVHNVGGAANKSILPAGLAQRATLDVEQGEIYVFFGSAKHRESSPSSVKPNSLWLFDIATSTWSMGPTKNASAPCRQAVEPSPRYAHQIIYDPTQKLHYLFGGNENVPNTSSSKVRLDDFWKMELVRLSGADVVRQAKYVIRKQKFRELCSSDALKAVQYLQQDVSEAVDSKCTEEMAEFHDLPTLLFSASPANSTEIEQSPLKPAAVQQNRVNVFSKLCQLFPEELVPPRENLVDLVRL